MKPTAVLVASTCGWPWIDRLAYALASAGCEVALAGPSRSWGTQAVARKLYSYKPTLGPNRFLLNAINDTRPDILVACDDRVIGHLHELHASAVDNPGLVALIERSLGAPDGFAAAAQRHTMLAMASEAGVETPASAVVHSSDELAAWLACHTLPCVLKVDGTWGGKGVRIARTHAELFESYRQLSRAASAWLTLKRVVAERDLFYIPDWLRQAQPVVSVQTYVQGRPANCAAFCWQGKVLASVAVEVLQTRVANGPATIVRVVPRPAMLQAARVLAERLHMSGMFGLDFMINDATDEALLIEMNPRATPLCHIQLGHGRDLPGALAMTLGNTARPPINMTDNDLIAFFPDAWNTPVSPLLAQAFHDIPWDMPELLRSRGRKRRPSGRRPALSN